MKICLFLPENEGRMNNVESRYNEWASIMRLKTCLRFKMQMALRLDTISFNGDYFLIANIFKGNYFFEWRIFIMAIIFNG